jgi:hypothetical protein
MATEHTKAPEQTVREGRRMSTKQQRKAIALRLAEIATKHGATVEIDDDKRYRGRSVHAHSAVKTVLTRGTNHDRFPSLPAVLHRRLFPAGFPVRVGFLVHHRGAGENDGDWILAASRGVGTLEGVPAAPDGAPAMNKILWTDADEAIANAEGWTLDDSAEAYSIQRLDELDCMGVPDFANDLEALAHVTCRALEGSDLHRRAIMLDGEVMQEVA